MFVYYLINFEDSILTYDTSPIFNHQMFFIPSKKMNNVFQVFNIFENNIIIVKLVKVLQYPYCHMEMKTNAPLNKAPLIVFLFIPSFSILLLLLFSSSRSSS
jgi:hypothetical protein